MRLCGCRTEDVVLIRHLGLRNGEKVTLGSKKGVSASMLKLKSSDGGPTILATAAKLTSSFRGQISST